MVNILSINCKLKGTKKLILVTLLAFLLGILFYYLGGIELAFIFVLSLIVASGISLIIKSKKKKYQDLY